ncbi:PcfJ domain-containing protein [Mesorhizobium amorphae]|uniref:PcfJ domain-containing protein n=1 Tax=Mesorhizobium amorphae TaxID=71433 RepID=UPI001186C8F1|nr:PcfJ domain-containing protein [Mesorhizobium amorphae]
MNAFNRPSYWRGIAAANQMQSLGLLPKEAWIDDAKARAAELFGGNEHLQTVACLIASSHPRAIDYLIQAPIAVRILAEGNTCRSVRQRQWLCRVVGEFAVQGPSLNAWLKARKISPHLRRLRPYALKANLDLRLFRMISAVNPSVLSQAIPEKGGFQRFWLDAIKAWCHRYERRNRDVEHLEWAVKNLAPTAAMPHVAGEYADYAMAIGADFDERWTLSVVERRSDEWHAEIAASGAANATLARLGLPATFEVDYAPFPDRHEIDNFTFVALKSAAGLNREGTAMHHCVSTYFNEVFIGRSRIYSVLKNGDRAATAEFGAKDFRPVQIKGTHNSTPPADLVRAVTQFGAHVRSTAAKGCVR